MSIRAPICIICGSNEDYICNEHYEILSNYSHSDCKLTIEVIGDDTPRAFREDPSTLPVINTHADVDGFLQMLNKELTQQEAEDFKFLVVITKDVKLTDEDLNKLFFINTNISPIALVFEGDSKTFIEAYQNWTPGRGSLGSIHDGSIKASHIKLPILVEHTDWLTILEYMRDNASLPNTVVYYKVLTNVGRSPYRT